MSVWLLLKKCSDNSAKIVITTNGYVFVSEIGLRIYEDNFVWGFLKVKEK